ncbi:MAG: hypothetical protein KF789_10970 [Bdellovibrionaceae bacterium]|nr:hypothetical protein [Pseudobdellovibrionaceae bacterium]
MTTAKLFLCTLFLVGAGCASKTTAQLKTESEWKVKNAENHVFVFPANLEAPVTYATSNDGILIEIPHRTTKIQIPLKIPKSALESVGDKKFLAQNVGQDYDLLVSRREEQSEGARKSDYEPCTVQKTEHKCETKTVTDPFTLETKQSFECEDVPVTVNGRKWVSYTPFTIKTDLSIGFFEPNKGQRAAVLSSQDVKESKKEIQEDPFCN